MNTVPSRPTATPNGMLRVAFKAGPPSPVSPKAWQLPANRVITSARRLIRRTQLLPASATYRYPARSSRARPVGESTMADAAGPESPLYP